MTDTHYPVLVYGTLRPGQGNYHGFLAGHTTEERDVRLDGFEMYTHGAFPYLVDGEGEVTATLVHIEDEDYAETLQSLDWLEGYTGPGPWNHYDRRLHTFELDGEQVRAWAYIAGAQREAEIREKLYKIENGDWIAFKVAYNAYLAAQREDVSVTG